MTSGDFEIRPMIPGDIEAGAALARAEGWQDRRRFYEFVLRVPTSQPLVAVADGRVVATGMATVNGPAGWLGGLIVDAGSRGRGIGRSMTEELIRRLRAAGCETLSLEATDAGRPIYERMGFRTATFYHQLEAGRLNERPATPEGTRVRPLEPADLPAIFALDVLATAEDRSAPLAVLAQAGNCWVIEPGDGLAGFLMPAERSYGAVIAPRPEDGLLLLELHRHVVPEGARVRAGIPHEHEAAWRELLARGWEETWLAPRMILGPDLPWRPEWIWGQINSAMG
jgi:predicted N-acetyltransferase YhbS